MAVTPKSLVRLAPAAVLLSIATYYALWGGEYSAFDLWSLATRQESETELLATTRADVDSLQVVIGQLENDPAAIEEVARERFGMIRDGEILYHFVDVEPAAEEAANP